MKLLALIVLFLLTGCSLFIQPEKSDLKAAIKKTKQLPDFCPIKQNTTQYLSLNENFLNKYQLFLDTLKLKKIKLKFIDKYVLYALLQMNVRPDQVSPTSRHQLFLRHKQKNYYFDFYAKKKSAYPFLFGLNFLLKKFKSRYSLKTLGSLIDKYQNEPILVSETLYNFLKKNKDRIKKNPILAKKFMRAGQILRPGESVPRPNYKLLINKYHKKNVGIFNTLIKYFPKKNSTINPKGNIIRCNMDLNLYSNSLYLAMGPSGQGANFAFTHKKSFVLGVASQDLQEIKSLWKTSLFKASGNNYQARLCTLSNIKGEMVLVSSEGKDPGQFLFHLLENGIQYANSFKRIQKFLELPRHQYLVNPMRIVYETDRSSKIALQNFLHSDIPIYHSSKLGNIWGWGKFGKLNGLIRDSRSESFVSCPKTAQQ
jgi:hypothetical protein